MAPTLRKNSQSGSPAKHKATDKSKRPSPRAKPKKATANKGSNAKEQDDSEDALSENEEEAYEVSSAFSDKELDSDALDSDDGAFGSPKKRKRASPRAKQKKSKKRRRTDEAEEDSYEDLPDGQTVVGQVVKAPTEGRVPPGHISKNTLNFLKDLAKPECNDREWFRLHEPVYRQAEKEWNHWIDAFTPFLIEVDDQIPPLPPKDVVHRIYRDVRFSNDKTPYKQGFSASFSRSGRKGIFAHYHIAIIPGGRSLVAAGAWQPGKNELATLRHHIKHDPSRFRDIISAPEFVKFFGKATPHPKGERQSVFGHDDQLKVAPKGIDKNHKDIDLLKLRSIAVIHNFLDSEVTAQDFKESVYKVIKVMQPLVHCLNDMMTLPVNENADSEDGEEDEE